MAAIVALPLCLALGVASGLGPATGLYGAIACGILAAIFGGTKAQCSGPTGPMTVVAASIIDLLIIGDTGQSSIWGALLGTTADKIMRSASCSVLIVRDNT